MLAADIPALERDMCGAQIVLERARPEELQAQTAQRCLGMPRAKITCGKCVSLISV